MYSFVPPWHRPAPKRLERRTRSQTQLTSHAHVLVKPRKKLCQAICSHANACHSTLLSVVERSELNVLHGDLLCHLLWFDIAPQATPQTWCYCQHSKTLHHKRDVETSVNWCHYTWCFWQQTTIKAITPQTWCFCHHSLTSNTTYTILAFLSFPFHPSLSIDHNSRLSCG